MGTMISISSETNECVAPEDLSVFVFMANEWRVNAGFQGLAEWITAMAL
jgi:hypothetical protein